MFKAEFQIYKMDNGVDFSREQDYVILPKSTAPRKIESKCLHLDELTWLEKVTITAETKFDIVILKHYSNINGCFETETEVIHSKEEQ
jgi:hypothetical protein